jgi:hypothetical protein
LATSSAQCIGRLSVGFARPNACRHAATIRRIPLIIDVFELARLGGEAAGALPVANLRRLLPSLASNEGELHFRYRGYLDNQGRPAGTLEFDSHGSARVRPLHPSGCVAAH